METSLDVLIVGAGPTGLMLANQLKRRGVNFLIIDRHDGPALESRALVVQARTLEIYFHLGIAGKAMERGQVATSLNLWTRGRHGARVPLGDIGQSLSPYPFLLILSQDENEKLLGEALSEKGARVLWKTELVGLNPRGDGAIATLRQADGSTRQISARWVAGCDGARSAVRELNGIPFLGAAYPHVFFVADTVATGPMIPNEVNVYPWLNGFHLFFPMKGPNRWRIIGILPPFLRGRDDLAFADVLPSVLKCVASSLSFQECHWFSTYRIHHRHAEHFRDRRSFLLGDAAHIHSPVGAQGMNTGLQDAYNLGWKLGLVSSGRAGEALLDSYEAERLPVARRLLRTTDRTFSFIVSDGWLSRLFRSRLAGRVLAFAMRFEGIRRFAFRTISQIGIRYRDSSLSQTSEGMPTDSPRAGDRFPWLKLKFSPDGPLEDLFARLDDMFFHLIVFGQPPPAEPPPESHGILRIHEVPADPDNDRARARCRIPSPSFYLLRPDGYIGLAGRLLDEALLSGYWSGRLKINS